MKVTKSMLREAWERQPGLRDYRHPGERRRKYPCCAVNARGIPVIPGLYLWEILIELNDEGFSAADGVTPVERRDCFLAMLAEGAFDAWLEEA